MRASTWPMLEYNNMTKGTEWRKVGDVRSGWCGKSNEDRCEMCDNYRQGKKVRRKTWKFLFKILGQQSTTNLEKSLWPLVSGNF